MTHRSHKVSGIIPLLIFWDRLISVGIITRKKNTIKLSRNKVRCLYNSKTFLNKATAQPLPCGSSEKIRKLRVHKDFDILHSNEREMLKIVNLMNKFCFKLGFLKASFPV